MKKPVFAALLLLGSFPIHAIAGAERPPSTEWGVISMGWNGKAPALVSGNLKITFSDETRNDQNEDRYIYTFMQFAELERAPKSVIASGCSIVENLDTSGGDTGVLHLPDTRHIAIYMNVEESFLVTPRVCLSVQY